MSGDKFSSFRVRTTREDGKITTVVDLLKDNEMMYRISTEIVNTKEKHVRESLVQLGWTPPREAAK